MRKLHYILAIMVAFMAAGCAPIFEESYDSLRLDYTEFSVSASAEKALVSIYYSGSWEAVLSDGTTWAQMEKISGTGITQNRILFLKNTGPVRKTVLTVTADNGTKWTVDVTQKGSSNSYLKFEANNIALPADALTIEVPFVTTMGDDYVLPMLQGFVTDEVSAIVTDHQVSEPEEIEEGTYRRKVTLTLSENQTGSSRTASLPLQMTSSDGTVYGEILKVVQDAEKAYIRATEKCVVNKNEAQHSFAFEHNLGYLAEDIALEIVYGSQEQNFIENATLAADMVKFNVSSTETDRTAEFKVVYAANGLDLSAVTEFIQVVNLMPRKISVTDLLALFVEGSQPYVPSDIYTDNVELYVVGGAGNPNMAQNINTGPNAITTEENDRTVYMQDAASGATQGFRIRFTDPEDNVFAHGDLVQLSLEGCTLKKESSPERYTIENVSATKVSKISEGNNIVPNVRSIATLAASDVYTYCTLENVEFQVKEGAYTNVREKAAIENPLSIEGTTPAMDGAANLLYDNAGNAIYTLINMGCDWRRNKVPSGTGNISGVVVHQQMPRWGGNVGTYSIRPLDKEDVQMEDSASEWKTLAEWVLTKGTMDHLQYLWKGDYSGEATATLKQNKMLATNGADAVLYSENLDGRTATTGLHQLAATPVTIAYGYRNLTEGSDGMSKGTALTFWGNAAGWYQWNSTSISGYNGIVMELSTENMSGSVVSVGFSTAAGYMKETALASQSSTSFPVYWTVEYSTDGTTWTQAANAATGKNGFEMRTVPATFTGESKAPHYGTKDKITVVTQSDMGFGYVPYRFLLPGSVLGQQSVKIRIRPSSDIIMCFNAQWDAGIASAGLRAISQASQKTNVNHGIFMEDVMIQYK